MCVGIPVWHRFLRGTTRKQATWGAESLRHPVSKMVGNHPNGRWPHGTAYTRDKVVGIVMGRWQSSLAVAFCGFHAGFKGMPRHDTADVSMWRA